MKSTAKTGKEQQNFEKSSSNHHHPGKKFPADPAVLPTIYIPGCISIYTVNHE
jgi:hypothetical protein